MISIQILIFNSQIVTIIKQKGNCFRPVAIVCGHNRCGLYNTCLRPRNIMPTMDEIYTEAIKEFNKYYSEEMLFEALL